MCTKDTINASALATDMGYAIALKIMDINFPDLVQIHLFVFCQSGPPKPTRPLTLNKEKNWYGLIFNQCLKFLFASKLLKYRFYTLKMQDIIFKKVLNDF